MAQTWNNFISAGTQWSNAANWLPAAAPASSVNNVFNFGASGLQTAVGYTTTNAGGAFDVNSLVFNAAGAPNGAVTVTNTLATDTIQFNTSGSGTLPSILQSSTGRVAFRHAVAGSAGVTLAGGAGGTTLEFLGSGIGDVFMDSRIVSTGAGASGSHINMTGTRRWGAGATVRLGGTNSTFSGNTVLDSGNLMLSNVLNTTGAINLTASVASTTVSSLGTGTLVINGGTVQFDPLAISSGATPTGITGTLQLNNNLLLNRDLNITGVQPATAPSGNINGIFGGVISGAGGINVAPLNGSNVYAFTGANTFSGVVNVTPVGNTVAIVQAGTANVSTGTFAGASGFVASGNSSITLNNVFGVQTRVNTVTAPTLTLNRGNFNLLGNASANTSETFGMLTTTGMGTVSVFNGSSTVQNTSLTFSSLNRGADNRGTLSIAATNLGSGTGLGEGILKFTANPGGALGGGGGAGTTTRSILPYALANTQAVTAIVSGTLSNAGTTLNGLAAANNASYTLVRWDSGTGRIEPLNLATEYAANLYTTGSTVPDVNMRLASSTAQPSAQSRAGLNNPAAAPYTTNSLVLDTNVAAVNPVGVSLAGTGTLRVRGGAIVSASNSGASAITLPSEINTPVLDFGSTTGYIHTLAGLTVNSNITGSGGLVKSQGGTLILNGNNTFTGGLTGASGPVQFSNDANLGAPGEPLVLNSGLTTALTFQPSNLHMSGPGTATVNRPVTIGDGGAVVSVTHANSALTLPGVIAGTGQFVKGGAGVLTLTGANPYTGNTVLGGGTLRVPNDAALGAPSSGIVFAGGTFEPTASFSTNRDMLLTATSILFTNGQNLTLTGDLTTPSTVTANTLVKDSPGDFTITSATSFTGAYQNGTSAPAVRGLNTAATTNSGRTILSGPNGSLSKAANVLILGGGEVVLDNSAAISNNRIGHATVGMAGNFTILGNAGGSVTESIGALSFLPSGSAPYGGTLTLVQPATGGPGETTALTATSTSANNGLGTVFVRGTNFAAASGDRTGLVFGTAPTLINSILPSYVGATSATSEPTTFLTTTIIPVPAPNSNVFALTPFAAYTAAAGALGAGAAANTYDVTGAASFTGAAAATALRISPGGSVALTAAGDVLTLGAGAVLSTGGANSGITGVGGLAFGALPARFTVTSNSALSVSPTISGTAGFIKSGDGTLTLNRAANLTTVATVGVAGGTLRYGIANALPIASNVFINGGATLDLNGNSSTLATIASFGNVALGAGNLTLSSGTAPTVAYGGSLSGTGALIKTGSNTVIFNGSSPAYTGQISILNGTLNLASDAAAGTGAAPILLGDTSGTNRSVLQIASTATSFSRNITVQSGSTPATPHGLETAGAGTTNISSNIILGNGIRLQGTSAAVGGTVTLSGTISESVAARTLLFFNGNWSLSGNNTYTGGTTFDTTTASWMGAGSDTAFGTGPLTFTAGFGTNLRADGGARTLANNVVVQPDGYVGFTGTNRLTLNGNVNLSAAATTQTFNVTNTAITTLGGIISNGTGGITKNGPGTLELLGANTYSGANIVNAGELKANNLTGSATGTGVVDIRAGAVLSGTGFLVPNLGSEAANLITLRTDAVLSPGNSPGILTAGSVTTTGTVIMEAGSIFRFEYAGTPVSVAVDTGGSATPGAGNDEIAVNGTLNINPNAIFSIAGDFNDYAPGQSYSFLVGTATNTVAAFDITAPAQFDTTGFLNYTTAALQWHNVGNNVFFNIVVPVPEPGTAGLAALTLGALTLRRRRK